MKSEIVVFDISDEGHRGNYVTFISGVLGARPLIGALRSHLSTVLDARILVLSTFESSPISFTLLTLIRSLLGRRTVLILLRPTILRVGISQRLKTGIHRLLAALPKSRLVVVAPLPKSSHLAGRVHFVRDPEFWDLNLDDVVDLKTDFSDEVVRSAQGRRILMFVGGISADKGVEHLANLMGHPLFSTLRMFVVVAGKVLPDAEPAISKIKALGGYVYDQFLSDEELFSLYSISTFAWCCYAPERDMSSGVFGRSLQFGVWPIVREGSLLGDECRALDYGSPISWISSKSAITAIAKIVPVDHGCPIDRGRQIDRLREVVFNKRLQPKSYAGGAMDGGEEARECAELQE